MKKKRISLLVLFILMVVWALWRKFFRKHSKNSKRKKILLLAMGGIGDAIMFAPTLIRFHDEHPDAEITLAVSTNSAAHVIYAQLASYYQALETFDIEPASWHACISQNQKWIEDGFDEVVISYLSAASIFFVLPTLISGESQQITLVDEHVATRFYKRLFTHVDILTRKMETHSEIETYSKILNQPQLIDRNWKLPIPLESQRKAKEWLKANQLWNNNEQASKRFALLHVGSFAAQDYKRYPIQKFAKVAQALSDQGFEVVVIGSPNERASATELSAYYSGKFTSCFDLDLLSVCSLLEHTSLFVGNDSGLGHLSILFNRPTVRIFGPSFYFGYKKWKAGKFEDVFQPLECTPCLRLGILEKKGLNAYTCGHRGCLDYIQPETIMKSIEIVLSQHD